MLSITEKMYKHALDTFLSGGLSYKTIRTEVRWIDRSRSFAYNTYKNILLCDDENKLAQTSLSESGMVEAGRKQQVWGLGALFN